MRYGKKAFAAANARFKASTQTRDYMFMLIKTQKKNNGLAQIDKNEGKIKETINLGKDKKPSYDVDDVSGKVFYRATPKTIDCFKF